MASNPNHHLKHDGGSECGSRATIIAAAAAVAPKPKVNAFTKYSSNLIRMKELLLLGHDSNEDDDEDLNYLANLTMPFGRLESVSVVRTTTTTTTTTTMVSTLRPANSITSTQTTPALSSPLTAAI
jgi:hypothetical protein